MPSTDHFHGPRIIVAREPDPNSRIMWFDRGATVLQKIVHGLCSRQPVPYGEEDVDGVERSARCDTIGRVGQNADHATDLAIGIGGEKSRVPVRGPNPHGRRDVFTLKSTSDAIKEVRRGRELGAIVLSEALLKAGHLLAVVLGGKN